MTTQNAATGTIRRTGVAATALARVASRVVAV